MKRILAFILAAALLLSGCSITGDHLKDPVTFYYLRSDYAYFQQDGVIVSEEREASGHKDDLKYLLALYLMGPSAEESVSPLPANCKILSLDQTETSVTITVSDCTQTVPDNAFTLACACLSLTCFQFENIQQVTLISGERTVTMHSDAMELFDTSSPKEESH